MIFFFAKVGTFNVSNFLIPDKNDSILFILKMTKKKELLKLLDFGQKRSHHDYTELRKYLHLNVQQ